MTSNILIMILLLTWMTFLAVMIKQQGLLMVLLTLEILILSVMLVIIITHQAEWSAVSLVILTFAACGASLGLACMVSLYRTHGNDRLATLSINKC